MSKIIMPNPRVSQDLFVPHPDSFLSKTNANLGIEPCTSSKCYIILSFLFLSKWQGGLETDNLMTTIGMV